MMKLGAVLGGLLVAVLFLGRAPAQAIPVFAHRYQLTCQACHTVVPHLTPFGEQFLANGYKLPGIRPQAAFPVALRFEAAYSSADDAGGRLPKTIVDEVELLAGGAIGSRGSFWLEPYVVDGGMPGVLRDAWVADRLTPDGARTPVLVRGGQFTLPLPLDPETFRETTDHYAIWDQTAGSNPFNFFDTKDGVQLAIGNPSRGLGGTFSLLQGHDTQSGLPSQGIDAMFSLERDLGNFRLQAYRYDGTRNIAGSSDRFWRNGFAAGWHGERTEVDAVYQTGNDASADGAGNALASSGAFVQLRQALGERTFAVARWDATQDGAFARTVTFGLGYRPTRNTRITLFDTVQRDDTGRTLHVISSSFLAAY